MNHHNNSLKEEQLSPFYSFKNRGSIRSDNLTEMHNVVGEVRVLQRNRSNRMYIERDLF